MVEGKEISSSNAMNNMISEISAELQREKQRNSELIIRISLLESQLQHQRDDDDDDDNHHLASHSNEQGGSQNARGRRFKKFKKQRTEAAGMVKIEDINMNSQTLCSQQNLDLRSGLVNWLNTNDHHFPNLENSKHTDSLLESEENSDDSHDVNDKDFNGNGIERKDVKDDEREGEKECTHSLCIGNSAVGYGETIEKERIHMKLSMQIKSQKMPFCPKEVTRILELKELFLKNAESHTIRKIIVFASLGIKHGCEDMYELDFDHFKILQKGDPYESPRNPSEHVVYENPGVRKKVFYPNRQNPAVCPIRILEEEKAMRPHDITCPSCLFLCIKYGGSTRNLPQQEYVRQRMGRNKLKSFGPIICRMAMLAHVRGGSFFFKALGITLLFMAGFSGDLVRLQTKYRNLDLLQKYCRTDEATEGK
ncbi:hypothetical protein L6452_35305 [Arctium lappa]|uniref:Uncharacterized protein n=1 Tax=Arctium lappa TaxID=4217 RepID=A0ACB8Y798_ARCLA|nr:hypothetical protein L6452_35305 [Arctium lappa]